MVSMTWTDEKIDDLATKVDDLSTRVDDLSARMDVGFTQVNGRIDVLEATTAARFDAVDERFDFVDRRLGRIEDKFDDLNRLVMKIGGGLIGTLIVSVVTVLATH